MGACCPICGPAGHRREFPEIGEEGDVACPKCLMRLFPREWKAALLMRSVAIALTDSRGEISESVKTTIAAWREAKRGEHPTQKIHWCPFCGVMKSSLVLPHTGQMLGTLCPVCHANAHLDQWTALINMRVACELASKAIDAARYPDGDEHKELRAFINAQPFGKRTSS